MFIQDPSAGIYVEGKLSRSIDVSPPVATTRKYSVDNAYLIVFYWDRV